MDFSKLSQNDKLAVYGAAAVILGGIVGFGAAGFGIVAVAAAVGMLALIFLPQLSPSTTLPGSKGSLMLLLGGIAAVILVLGLLTILMALGLLLQFALFATLFFLIAVAGGVLMAWAGWQEFQAEGGKFQLGSSSPGAPASTPTQPPPSASTAAGPETSAPPVAETDRDRRTES